MIMCKINFSKSGTRRRINFTLALLLSVFTIFSSRGVGESVHSLAHLMFGEHCPEVVSSSIESETALKILKETNLCAIKSTLAKSFSNTLLIFQDPSVFCLYFDKHAQNIEQRSPFLLSIKNLWRSPRGPPSQV